MITLLYQGAIPEKQEILKIMEKQENSDQRNRLEQDSQQCKVFKRQGGCALSSWQKESVLIELNGQAYFYIVLVARSNDSHRDRIE
jgi:hypothetical protein